MCARVQDGRRREAIAYRLGRVLDQSFLCKSILVGVKVGDTKQRLRGEEESVRYDPTSGLRLGED